MAELNHLPPITELPDIMNTNTSNNMYIPNTKLPDIMIRIQAIVLIYQSWLNIYYIYIHTCYRTFKCSVIPLSTTANETTTWPPGRGSQLGWSTTSSRWFFLGGGAGAGRRCLVHLSLWCKGNIWKYDILIYIYIWCNIYIYTPQLFEGMSKHANVIYNCNYSFFCWEKMNEELTIAHHSA